MGDLSDETQQDYDNVILNSRRKADQAHEEKMRSTRVKLAKIEAKAKVEAARASNRAYQEHLTGRRALAAVMLVLLGIIGGCTYTQSRPEVPDPEKQRIQQERYEKCMDIEKDYDTCKFAGNDG